MAPFPGLAWLHACMHDSVKHHGARQVCIWMIWRPHSTWTHQPSGWSRCRHPCGHFGNQAYLSHRAAHDIGRVQVMAGPSQVSIYIYIYEQKLHGRKLGRTESQTNKRSSFPNLQLKYFDTSRSKTFKHSGAEWLWWCVKDCHVGPFLNRMGISISAIAPPKDWVMCKSHFKDTWVLFRESPFDHLDRMF